MHLAPRAQLPSLNKNGYKDNGTERSRMGLGSYNEHGGAIGAGRKHMQLGDQNGTQMNGKP